MVKEFEQQHEQDLAILIDPWLPRTKVTPERREALEEAIKFAATVCFETCRHPGRRLLLGWTGATPGVRQGPASVKLLHEFLDQLATLRPSPEASLSDLLDVVPASTLRESFLIVVSTRPINLLEEAERSTRLSAAALRGLLGRVTLVDASKGDLANLIQFGKGERAGQGPPASGIGAPSNEPAPSRGDGRRVGTARTPRIGSGGLAVKFQAIYRASFYLMLTFATLVLSIDATDDNPFAMLYPHRRRPGEPPGVRDGRPQPRAGDLAGPGELAGARDPDPQHPGVVATTTTCSCSRRRTGWSTSSS